jgi:tetratricopeptide (TPR) repeat protein
MLAFKGNIETRHGWKKQGQDDQEQAVRHLEPLLDSSELSQKDRINAAILWSRAASPFAIGLAAKGDFQSAKELLEKILSKLNSLKLDSFEGSLLKIQSYGNLAMVNYFSKDTEGTHEALEQARLFTAKCENFLDESVPFREIVEFEIMRCTLMRFHGDLMLTEGKIDPAIEMQSKSLEELTNAIATYPGNVDLHTAYTNCITRLQAILVEHGRLARANEVTQAWLELAQQIHNADDKNPNTRQFLLLAYHTIGHLSEATQQMTHAQQHYREALSIAEISLGSNPQSEHLLAQVLEITVHLIRFELCADDFQMAQSQFEQAIAYATKLKSLPDKTDQYQSGIKNQLQAALRFLQDSAHNSQSDLWIELLRESELLH